MISFRLCREKPLPHKQMAGLIFAQYGRVGVAYYFRTLSIYTVTQKKYRRVKHQTPIFDVDEAMYIADLLFKGE